MTALTDELKTQYQNYNQEQLDSVFVNACENGDLNIIKYLLTSPDLTESVRMNIDRDWGFHWACFSGHLEVVKYLLISTDLKWHVDIHSQDAEGFRLACKEGHLDIVQYLSTSPDLKEHININTKNCIGFLWACKQGYLNVATYLLSFNGDQCVDFQNSEYHIEWAMKHKYNDVIIAMMNNLKTNNFLLYFEFLSKIEEYNKELYEQVKNIQAEGLEVNPLPEMSLLL